MAASIIDTTPLRPAIEHLWRRALRIYPAFWVALGLIVWLTSEHFKSTAMAINTATLVQIHHPEWVRGPMPQAWSLATEISFYVMLPIGARLARPLIGTLGSRSQRVAALMWCMVGLYLTSVFFRLWLYGLANDWTPAALLWLPALIDYFAIGMTLAVAYVGLRSDTPLRDRLERLGRPAGMWWLLAAVVFVVLSQGGGLARGMESAGWPREMVRHFCYGVIALMLLFPLIFGDCGERKGLVRRFTSGTLMVALGRVSYSVYLWHMVFIVHLWQPFERVVERIWNVTVRAEWFDTAFGWSGLVERLDSRFATLAVIAGVPTLAVSAASYLFVERLALKLSRLVKRHRQDVTAIERAVSSLARSWNNAAFRLRLGVIGVVAAAVRFGYVFLAKRTESILEPDSVFPGDQFYYALAGDALADGRGFVVPWHDPSMTADFSEFGMTFRGSEALAAAPQAADHPPLTALVSAIAGFLPGEPGTHVVAQRLTMAVVGVVSVVVVGLLGRAVGGARVGIGAALLAALYAGFWVNDGLVMSETLVVAATAAALLAALRFHRTPNMAGAVLLGGCVGVAALARSEALMLVPLLVLPVVWMASGSWRTRLYRSAAALAAVVVLIAPWVSANLVRFNEPVFMSTNIGLTLAGANNPQTYEGGALGFWTLEHVEETVDVNGLDQSEASERYLESALNYARNHPEQLPAVVAARIGRVWSTYRPLQMVELNQGEGRERWASLLALAGYVVLVPAAARGWWRLWRAGQRTDAWIMGVPFVQVTLVAAAFYGLVRLRATAEIAIVVLAALAFSSWSSEVSATATPGDQVSKRSSDESPDPLTAAH